MYNRTFGHLQNIGRVTYIDKHFCLYLLVLKKDLSFPPYYLLGAVAESVERWSRVREIVGSNPGGGKPMTYQIDTGHIPARCSTLLG